MVAVLTIDSFGRLTVPVITGDEGLPGPGQISTLLCDDRGDALREQHYVRMLQGRRVQLGRVSTGPLLGGHCPRPRDS